MQNIRPISQEKWGVTKHAFYQAYHFAMRYHEFRDVLKYKTNTMGSQEINGMPRGSRTGDATQNLAIIRQQAAKNVEMIEQTAIEASGELYQYILKNVTEEGASFKYLTTVMNMPAGKDMFYDRRRKFYFLLSKKI